MHRIGDCFGISKAFHTTSGNQVLKYFAVAVFDVFEGRRLKEGLGFISGQGEEKKRRKHELDSSYF
jgi:hypothetical protein